MNIEENVSNDNIISIEEVDYPDDIYVYDIETEDGSFQAGTGCIILKNTDSIYTKFMLPENHGLTASNLLSGYSDYTFEVSNIPDIRFIVVDLANRKGFASGLVRKKRMEKFLVSELERALLDGKYVIVFTHFPSSNLLPTARAFRNILHDFLML